MIRRTVNKSEIQLVEGDITVQDTRAIVNAANKRLSPGGGVSGAIHRAAGPGLWEEASKIGGCETGRAKITSGHNLKAEYVIHTVGPVYTGARDEEGLLRNSYLNSLKLAAENNIESISFPAISAGIFGYPLKEAARIAVSAVIDFLKDNTVVKTVRFVVFSREAYGVYERQFKEQLPG